MNQIKIKLILADGFAVGVDIFLIMPVSLATDINHITPFVLLLELIIKRSGVYSSNSALFLLCTVLF
jgi:hypothetical protein